MDPLGRALTPPSYSPQLNVVEKLWKLLKYREENSTCPQLSGGENKAQRSLVPTQLPDLLGGEGIPGIYKKRAFRRRPAPAPCGHESP